MNEITCPKHQTGGGPCYCQHKSTKSETTSSVDGSPLNAVVIPPPVPSREEMLDALPHTADGAPILPGMMVYCIVGQHVDERRVIGPDGKMALNTFEPARHGAGPGQCHRLANTVYAVRENALEAAKAV